MPFNIYADFEPILKGVRSSNRNDHLPCAEKYQDHIPCSFVFVYKFVCIDDKFSKPNAVYRFIETILEEYHYCKSAIKKYFNKSLVMYGKEEKRFP